MDLTINRDEFFRKATVAIAGTLDLQEALDRCHALVNEHFQVEALSLMVYDSAAMTVRFLAKSKSSPWNVLPATPVTIPPYLRDFMDRTHRDKTPFSYLINSLDDLPLGERLLSDLESRDIPTEILKRASRIFVCVAVNEGILAFLEAWKPPGEPATEEQAAFLLLLKEPLTIVVANALAHEEVLKLKAMLEDDTRFFQEELHSIVGDRIIGEESGLRNVMEMVAQVAPKNSPVMLFGETGVGKDLIANAIHYKSLRRNGPFVKVNCGAIPESLIDSELFGHEKGAFTGALARQRGRFERAHGGTIFLDEIGELPPAAQVRLLRVLHNKELERVGGSEVINVDARVISATNRRIDDMVSDGRFREDLFYRLNVFPIIIPPLRQRRADIPLLLRYFLEKKSLELRIPDRPPVAPGVEDRLMNYRWPGNVRELENMVERELIMSRGEPLRFPEVRAGNPEQAAAAPAWQPSELLTLAEVNANHIQRALRATGGKICGPDGAARALGLNPSTLRGRMKKLGIPFGRSAQRQ